MKTIRLVVAIIFAIFYLTPYSFAADTYTKDVSPGKSNLISMDFQDANLKTVLKVFSQQSGLNFIASQNVQERTVTVYFDNVKVEDALNYIMKANNLGYEQESGTNIFIVKETGKPEVETITKIYELKYAQLNVLAKKESGSSGSSKGSAGSTVESEAEIVSVIKNILSLNGKVIADKRSNSLIIKDVPSQFPIIEDLLARVDVRTPQVMIKVEVLEVTTKAVENLGINWSGSFGTFTGPVHNTIFPMNNTLGRNNSTGEGIATTGTFSMSGVTAAISALLTDSGTKILARPQVMAMNNETARIELSSKEKDTETVAATSSSTGVGVSGKTWTSQDTGVILEVTPQISKDGYVTMNLKPSVTELEASRFTSAYDSHKRSAETTVIVKDGETVVIGGLIKAKHQNSVNKVPFFGDIPFMGAAFRYKSKENTDRELIVFITPTIIKDSSFVALGSISEREQEKPKAVREKEVNTVLDLFGG